jgi:drug/metabolite transporter (DMT)-like permease
MLKPATSAVPPPRRRTGLLLALVTLNIGLQLVNAALIKYASRLTTSQLAGVTLVLTLVVILSFARFVVWGGMHKRFPVSVAYPATALFFPCLVAVAAAFGEHVSAVQVAGACLVTSGVIMLLWGAHPAKGETPS